MKAEFDALRKISKEALKDKNYNAAIKALDTIIQAKRLEGVSREGREIFTPAEVMAALKRRQMREVSLEEDDGVL